MPKPRFLGCDPTYDRKIWLLELDALRTAFDWEELEQQKFVCLCAIDASSISRDELSSFCSRLIDLGCAYFCAWGPDCERVHDIMDRLVIGDNPPQTDIGCLMTTWHPRDTIAKAVFFFLSCAEPDEEYAPAGCSHGLAVVIGSAEWAAQFERHIRKGVGAA